MQSSPRSHEEPDPHRSAASPAATAGRGDDEAARAEAIAREFDAKAKDYEANRPAPWYKAHAEHILERLDLAPGDVVLDVGCATGYLLRRLTVVHPGVRGIGVDIAPRMVEVARRSAEAEAAGELVFVQSDWERPSKEAADLLAGHRVRCIVCASTFHYFAQPGRAARAMFDLLAPGGSVLILERARENSALTAIWGHAHRFLLRDHVTFFESARIIDILERAGFDDVHVASRLKRMLWKNKLYTSLALVRGSRPYDSSKRWKA